MNFFKSVFSDEPTPPDSPTSPPTPTETYPEDPTPSQFPNPTWSLGGLLKTLATKSESVVEAYRRDIEELGSGLRAETSIIREVASRAVKELPASLEAGASVAQESLESVGQAIDDIGSTVWKSTARMILGKDNHVLSDLEPDSTSISSNAKRGSFDVKYSRFDAQLRGMQGDLDTFCNEPEDKADYEEWRLNCWVFDEERKEEIKRVFRDTEVVREVYNEVVPSRVECETFWRRYFYRLDRLKKAEEARAMIVKRAISVEGEEDLSWDFDEDNPSGYGGSAEVEEEKSVGKAEDFKDGKLEEKRGVVEEAKGNGNGRESCKDSDISVVSSQSMLAEVEDLGWDEIEYAGSNDEGKGEASGSTSATSSLSRVDLRKRLSAAEEEEDLSWDIEDEDDEPVKW